MDLKTYLDNEGLTPTAFAAKLGVAHTTVLRWLTGDSFPGPDKLAAIARLTNSAVTANDFMATHIQDPSS